MPQYEIIESFKGSQDGRHTEAFEAGTTRELSDYLVACAPRGSIRAVGAEPVVENKATITRTSRNK